MLAIGYGSEKTVLSGYVDLTGWSRKAERALQITGVLLLRRRRTANHVFVQKS